jgi:hypothetical protein
MGRFEGDIGSPREGVDPDRRDLVTLLAVAAH